ncbi:protein of unknown function [Legionella fallonii LLAP-10]|uniref:Uncharacterized protein n=1 Tax=Legionella fallonii LLAP-10 TaxID=1212491 RepID=A0A098G5N6_9GAMM|nr:protein of unknown function [Legionella fallonii LLAP-10]
MPLSKIHWLCKRSNTKDQVAAQISAAKLATHQQISFASEPEKLKNVFTHCQYAGEAGQHVIDNYFMRLTRQVPLTL